jgi:hypothetical protein
MKFKRVRSVIALTVIAAGVSGLSAQQGRGGAAAPPQPPPSGAAQGPSSESRGAQAAAPIDLTGYWVSIVNEDWRWRMVTPPKGDVASVPLNAEGRKVADAWDPKTEGSCLAYGAAGLMRIPTRLHITWESENVLKIETDAGQQTRRLLFDKSTAKPAQRSLQGFSIAEWERPAPRGFGGGGGFGPGGGAGAGAPPPGAAGGPPAARTGDLKVVTTNLSGGWLRKNGVPYSEDATVTEYFDRFATPGGDEWLVVTTVVADPKYLSQEFVTSTHFRREPNAAKWDPTPCRATP